MKAINYAITRRDNFPWLASSLFIVPSKLLPVIDLSMLAGQEHMGLGSQNEFGMSSYERNVC